MLCQFKNFGQQSSTQIYRTDSKQQQQTCFQEVWVNRRSAIYFLAQWIEFLTAADCWSDTFLPDRSPSRPSWTWSQTSANSLNHRLQTFRSQKLASTIQNGAFTVSKENRVKDEKFPWSLQRDGGVRGRHERLRGEFICLLSLRGGGGGGLRGSANQCRASSPVCTRGLTSSIISIDRDSDRCRPWPPDARLCWGRPVSETDI